MARYIDADIFQKNLSMEIYMAEDEDFTGEQVDAKIKELEGEK